MEIEMEQLDLYAPIVSCQPKSMIYPVLCVSTPDGSISVQSKPEWKIVVRGEITFEELVVALAGSNLPALLVPALWAAIQKVEKLDR